jgi:hypothetical protein
VITNVLKDPKGVEGVSLKECKANVDFAVKTAASKAGNVAIGDDPLEKANPHFGEMMKAIADFENLI